MLKAINASVVRDVEIDDALPLTLEAGDRVTLEHAHPSRAGYHWCTDGGICSGWVPEVMLLISGNSATARDVFCSQQLAVSAGDSVRVMWKGQGFADTWCENRDGDRGWVPNDALQFSEADPEE